MLVRVFLGRIRVSGIRTSRIHSPGRRSTWSRRRRRSKRARKRPKPERRKWRSPFCNGRWHGCFGLRNFQTLKNGRLSKIIWPETHRLRAKNEVSRDSTLLTENQKAYIRQKCWIAEPPHTDLPIVPQTFRPRVKIRSFCSNSSR